MNKCTKILLHHNVSKPEFTSSLIHDLFFEKAEIRYDAHMSAMAARDPDCYLDDDDQTELASLDSSISFLKTVLQVQTLGWVKPQVVSMPEFDKVQAFCPDCQVFHYTDPWGSIEDMTCDNYLATCPACYTPSVPEAPDMNTRAGHFVTVHCPCCRESNQVMDWEGRTETNPEHLCKGCIDDLPF